MYIHSYIHLIAITLSWKNENKKIEKTLIGDKLGTLTTCKDLVLLKNEAENMFSVAHSPCQYFNVGCKIEVLVFCDCENIKT